MCARISTISASAVDQIRPNIQAVSGKLTSSAAGYSATIGKSMPEGRMIKFIKTFISSLKDRSYIKDLSEASEFMKQALAINNFMTVKLAEKKAIFPRTTVKNTIDWYPDYAYSDKTILALVNERTENPELAEKLTAFLYPKDKSECFVDTQRLIDIYKEQPEICADCRARGYKLQDIDKWYSVHQETPEAASTYLELGLSAESMEEFETLRKNYEEPFNEIMTNYKDKLSTSDINGYYVPSLKVLTKFAEHLKNNKRDVNDVVKILKKEKRWDKITLSELNGTIDLCLEYPDIAKQIIRKFPTTDPKVLRVAMERNDSRVAFPVYNMISRNPFPIYSPATQEVSPFAYDKAIDLYLNQGREGLAQRIEQNQITYGIMVDNMAAQKG